jgi:hypothetical protein
MGCYQLPEPITVTRCFLVCCVIFAGGGTGERFLLMRLSLRAAVAGAVKDLAMVAIEADDRVGGMYVRMCERRAIRTRTRSSSDSYG